MKAHTCCPCWKEVYEPQLKEAETYIGDLQDEVAALERENRDLQRALNAAPTDEDLQ